MMMDEVLAFEKNCGIILRQALIVEGHLEFLITEYFFEIPNPKKFVFKDTIFSGNSPMSFEQKICILEEICKRDKIDPEKTKKLFKNIRVIKKIRNQVAHDEAYLIEEKIYLQKHRSITQENDRIRVDSALVEKIRNDTSTIVREINDIYNVFIDSKKIRPFATFVDAAPLPNPTPIAPVA